MFYSIFNEIIFLITIIEEAGSNFKVQNPFSLVQKRGNAYVP
jgi:hypothetical protein